MRIIAGDFKGRRLESPKDNSVRPTTDKAREALFSILANDIWGSRVLDLFGGTGGLGLEALSRGAAECVFADQSKESIRMIKNNIAHCGAGDRSRVMTGDFRRVLASQREPFDLIFLDPPYGSGMMDTCFSMIRENELLKEEGFIVAEHRKEEQFPEEFHGYRLVKQRRYGIVMLSIYGCTDEA